MKTPKILIVGSINMDFLLYGAPDHYPPRGGHIDCRSYAYAPGGKGAIQACAAAKLGGQAALVGRIGKDANGQAMLEALSGQGVDIRFVRRMDELSTGLSVLCTEDNGCYHAFGVPGANTALCEADVAAALAAEDFDMLIFQLEMPIETAICCHRLAKEKGIPAMLDAGPAKAIPLHEFSGIEFLSPNEAEVMALIGMCVEDEASAAKAARLLREKTAAAHVLLKMGSKGIYYLGSEGEGYYPAHKVAAVDTAGAGDTFNAAFAIRRCQGAGIADAIAYGQKAAAISVTKKGSLSSVPSAREVEQTAL
ncbi:MAG: ribokinase [Christensenellaceae bacterium]|nr:ribokinase [Christensenellaceae bacterium]